MNFLALVLIMLIGIPAFAQSLEITSASRGPFKKAYDYFSQGKYESTIEELRSLEASGVEDKTQLGLINYWKGICYNRTQNFSQAIAHFDKSLGLGYSPLDLNYEYGQALFASERLPESRLQFRESLKRRFKRSVSLYYIAYISKELGERKKAVTFYKAIDKIEDEDSKEVRQAAQTQIGDIYLEQVEKQSNAINGIQVYVIPQYKKALEIDRQGPMAREINSKIQNLQRKYDLILFRLANGRPTLNPPYFVRLAQEVGFDTNVTFAPTETVISKAKQGSSFSKTDVLGRYTFYYKNFLSFSPELRFNYTRYFNREPEIFRNDNYLIAPALRTSYEHTLWEKPASILFDYEYADARRDVNAKKELEFSSRSHTLMLGERFNYFSWGESIFRLRHRIFQSYLSAYDANTTSLVFEQIKSFKMSTLLFTLSYDRTRVKEELFDTDAYTLRTDLILGRVRDWFTPSISLGLTSTDPINDRADRGRELLINPGARISKTFKKKWRGNLKYDYQKNSSKNEEAFAYTKSVYSLELEYLF